MRITIAMTLLVAACSSSGKGPAEACEETSECDGDLTCLPFAVFTGGTCMEVGQSCSVTCDADADCAELGESFRCFATCGAQQVCGATAM